MHTRRAYLVTWIVFIIPGAFLSRTSIPRQINLTYVASHKPTQPHVSCIHDGKDLSSSTLLASSSSRRIQRPARSYHTRPRVGFFFLHFVSSFFPYLFHSDRHATGTSTNLHPPSRTLSQACIIALNNEKLEVVSKGTGIQGCAGPSRKPGFLTGRSQSRQE